MLKVIFKGSEGLDPYNELLRAILDHLSLDFEGFIRSTPRIPSRAHRLGKPAAIPASLRRFACHNVNAIGFLGGCFGPLSWAQAYGCGAQRAHCCCRRIVGSSKRGHIKARELCKGCVARFGCEFIEIWDKCGHCKEDAARMKPPWGVE